MRRPGPPSPLLPVALDRPAACQSEGAQEEEEREKKGVWCQKEGWLEEGTDTHQPQAAAAENRSAPSLISASNLVNKLPLIRSSSPD